MLSVKKKDLEDLEIDEKITLKCIWKQFCVWGERVYWMHLAWGRNLRLAVTSMAMKLWFPLNAGGFWTTDWSRKSLFCVVC